MVVITALGNISVKHPVHSPQILLSFFFCSLQPMAGQLESCLGVQRPDHLAGHADTWLKGKQGIVQLQFIQNSQTSSSSHTCPLTTTQTLRHNKLFLFFHKRWEKSGDKTKSVYNGHILHWYTQLVDLLFPDPSIFLRRLNSSISNIY